MTVWADPPVFTLLPQTLKRLAKKLKQEKGK